MTEAVYTADRLPVVGSEWVSEHLADEGLALVDVRAPYFFAQAHLPGAVNLPSFFLHGPDGGPPPADDLAARLGALGLIRDTHIVAYDEGGSPGAATLYWVLRYYRHPRVSVLDGGITRWRHQGRGWESTLQLPAPARYETGEPDAGIYADHDEVLSALDDPGAVVLDVRSPAEYLGLQPTAQRDGHIPGAVNLEWSNALQADADGLPILRPPDDIRDLLARAGISPSKEIIVHCQSGSRSSFVYLVLDALQFPRVRHYVRGWHDWGNRADTPVEAR